MDQSASSIVEKKVNKGALTTTVRMMMKSCKNVLLKAGIDLLYWPQYSIV